MKLKRMLTLFILIMAIMLSSTKVLAENNIPKPSAEGAIVVDVDSKDILFIKNPDKRLYPASTTKLLTAILLAENKKPGYILTYSSAAASQEPFILGLKPGTKITAEEAMDAMLLYSANDIAYMIGENLGVSKEGFAAMMNSKIQSLKLSNTHFVTANGLHDDNHFTSAYDLSVIAREAYKYPWIMNTLKKTSSQIKLDNNTVIALENRNKLLNKDGNVGGKTGFTTPAGRCLVSYYERDGRRLVGVVLKSEKDSEDKMLFKDMEDIINYSYNLKKTTLYSSGKAIKDYRLSYKLFNFFGPEKEINTSLYTDKDVQVYESSDNRNIHIEPLKINPFNIKKNTPVAKLFVDTREKQACYFLYSTVSSKDILRSNLIPYSLVTFLILSLIIFLYFKFKKVPKQNIRYR